MVSFEELFRSVSGQVFCNVYVFAAAIVSFARIAFSIFVCQQGTLGLQYAWAYKVFRSDQFDFVALSFSFIF